MAAFNRHSLPPIWFYLPSLAVIALVTILTTAGASASDSPTSDPFRMANGEECLSCHGDPNLQMTLPSGEELSLHIPQTELEQSIHEDLGISCGSCHRDIEAYPHPPLEYKTRRELALALGETCHLCHADNYTDAQDSIHARVSAAGNTDAPVCTDCHGAHDIQPPDQPRSLVSTTCGRCHTEIFTAYSNSVHGSSLIDDANPDVPVCTDCHGVHNIQDPRLPQFRVATPELCAGCHADAQLIEKYGLSENVYSLYQLSWHGVDVRVYKARWPTIWHESAVCTDCHGVHEIRSAADPASKVSQENLLGTCRQCHPQVGPNWTDAWTGHHPVSRVRTPFVFYTQAFYETLVRLVLIGSGLYVILHIFRGFVARVRRSLP